MSDIPRAVARCQGYTLGVQPGTLQTQQSLVGSTLEVGAEHRNSKHMLSQEEEGCCG
jgi:hypothetical protein